MKAKAHKVDGFAIGFEDIKGSRNFLYRYTKAATFVEKLTVIGFKPAQAQKNAGGFFVLDGSSQTQYRIEFPETIHGNYHSLHNSQT